jgi:arabinogalactan endo-1,4-beta-galactosidase
VKIEYLVGDMNGDSVIDIFDVVAYRKLLVSNGGIFEGSLSENYKYDFNDDNQCNMADLVKLQRYVLGYPDDDFCEDIITIVYC